MSSDEQMLAVKIIVNAIWIALAMAAWIIFLTQFDNPEAVNPCDGSELTNTTKLATLFTLQHFECPTRGDSARIAANKQSAYSKPPTLRAPRATGF